MDVGTVKSLMPPILGPSKMNSTNTETKSADVRLRLEPGLKDEAVKVLAGVGLELSIAIRLFLKQVGAKRGIPLQVGQPNARENPAMRQADSTVQSRVGPH